MVMEKRIPLILILLVLGLGCLESPVVDKEKAGLLAGIRFLETHPGEIAKYSVRNGGDFFLVYFNITAPNGQQKDFAEYYVDKYNRDVYVSGNYASRIAMERNPNVRRILETGEGKQNLLKLDNEADRGYVWEVKLTDNKADLGVFYFDAVAEKLIQVRLRNFDVELDTFDDGSVEITQEIDAWTTEILGQSVKGLKGSGSSAEAEEQHGTG
jgi:hypothetical protein